VEIREGMPYWSADTPFQKSYHEIMLLLEKHGANRILQDKEKYRVPPKGDEVDIYRLGFTMKGTPYIIEFPITYRAYKNPKVNPPKLDMRISGRVMYHLIKALLVNEEINFLSAGQALTMFMALPSARGPIALKDAVEQNPKALAFFSPEAIPLPAARAERYDGAIDAEYRVVP